jgi:aryl-alcohol dehydrogenase-like predicted oxidoreductase
MRYRRFGNSELRPSEVGFGCARIGGVFHGSSRKEIVALLRQSFDHGITFFDTADMYTQGESERLVGEALHDVRRDVIIASKFGYQLPRQKRLVGRFKPLVKPVVARLGLSRHRIYAGLRGSVSQQDFSPTYIRSAVEASLRRLRTDYIDIYQLHDPSVDVLGGGEFVEALELLKQQGKIRHWGVACQQPEEAVIALRYRTLGSIQIGLSVLEQAALDAAIPAAAERGVGVIARQVFASGLLTRPAERLELDHIDHDHARAVRKRDQLASYASIAKQHGRNPAEMALQFNLIRDDVSVVLLGISRRPQLEAALAALNSPALSVEEHQHLIACRRVGP